MTIKKICVLGLGHAGVPLSAIIALKCPEIRVTVVQNSADHIFQLNVKQIPSPIYVAGLEELIRKCQNKNLFFTTSEGVVIKEADIIFIVSESRLKTYGEGKDECVDLSAIEEAAFLIAEHAETNKIVVENSFIPMRTAECVRNVLKYNGRPGIQFQVVSNPEFYEEGSALKNLLFPNCVLLGSDNTPQGYAAAKTVAGLYERWVSPLTIVTQKNWTVELIKIVSSAMVAQRMATIYAFAAICEESDGDVSQVVKVLMKDSGIGTEALTPSLSVGRLPAAVRTLIYMCESNEMLEVADYWRQVLVMYSLHKDRFFSNLTWALRQTVWNKRVTVLGYAYHKDTEVTRGSAAIELCKTLLAESATVNVYDPRVTQEKVVSDLLEAGCPLSGEQLKKVVCVYADPYRATSQVQVMIGCADWSDFSNLDYKRIFDEMVKPAVVFDTGLIFNHSDLLKIGFKVTCHYLPEPKLCSKLSIHKCWTHNCTCSTPSRANGQS